MSDTGGVPWYQRGIAIMSHQYNCDIPAGSDPATLTNLIRWKRSLGFEVEHLILNGSLMEGGEGGDDPARYRFRNRHGFMDDYLGAYLPIAHEQGLRVIVYFNCHWFRSGVFPDDFYVLDNQGQLVTLYGSGRGTCPRGPFRQWSQQIAEDLAGYDIDGIFLDGPLQQHCFCQTCRDAFRAQFGADHPPTPEKCPPELFDAYHGFPADATAGYVRAFAESLHRVNPGVALYINDRAHGGDGRVMRATAGATQLVGAEGGFFGYGPLDERFPFGVGACAKVLEARSRGRKPVVFCDGGYKSYDYHAHPKGEVARMYASSISNGAAPWFLFLRSAECVPGGQTAIRFNRLIQSHRDELGPTRSLAQAAILHSPLNLKLAHAADASARDDVGKQSAAAGKLTVSRHWHEFLGTYSALARSGYPFDVIEEPDLLDGQLPPRLKLIILPAVGAMSTQTADVLRRFVAAGGSVLATFDSSLYDTDGRLRTDYLLADVFGASISGPINGPSGLDYLTAAAGDGWAHLLPQSHQPCPEYWWHLHATSAKPLLHYCQKMPRRYALRPDASEYPAATSNRFGQGHAILISACLGDQFLTHAFPSHRTLLHAAACQLAKPLVEIDGGDEFVETTLRQAADGTIILHLTNWASGRRPATHAIPLGPLTIRLRLPEKLTPRSIHLAWSNIPAQFRVRDNAVEFTIARLDEYEMVIVR